MIGWEFEIINPHGHAKNDVPTSSTVIARNEAIQSFVLSNLKTQEQYNQRYTEAKYNNLESKIYNYNNQLLYYF